MNNHDLSGTEETMLKPIGEPLRRSWDAEKKGSQNLAEMDPRGVYRGLTNVCNRGISCSSHLCDRQLTNSQTVGEPLSTQSNAVGGNLGTSSRQSTRQPFPLGVLTLTSNSDSGGRDHTVCASVMGH